MGLKQNGFRDNIGALRFFGATVSNGAYPYVNNKAVSKNTVNVFVSDADYDQKSSAPDGVTHPVAFLPALKNGGLSARYTTRLTSSATASIAVGKPITATGTATSSSTAAMTSLVNMSATASVSGTGSADLTVLKFAFLEATGTATSSGTAAMTCLTFMSASGAASGTGAAEMTCEVNMTATGSGSVAGSATMTSLVFMSATSSTSEALSPTALAAAVWSATASSYNTTGTMGEKLNAAGGGSSPSDIAQGVWEYIIESGFEAQEILRLLSAVSVGSATGLEGAAPTFKDIADTKTRITATYANGTRTVTALDAT